MTSYDKGPSNISRYGNEAWTFLKVDQTLLESFEMWCWRRMHKKKKGFSFCATAPVDQVLLIHEVSK